MTRPASRSLTRFGIDEEETVLIPTLTGSIPAGSPTNLASEIYPINLRELLLADTPEPLLFRICGLSMAGEVDENDWILASCALEPDPGEIVIAMVNGEMTLKHFETTDRGKRGLYLVPNNKDFPTRELTYADDVQILAVVTKVIRDMRRRRKK